jgi:cellulose synthase/poly-beta-1,6-N-acetylglucosamine synthase-like glycosyltransferase
VLRDVGGWDSYNVTEDADLGIRLARFGYRSTVIDSTTYEEAPAYLGPWIRQRTRWMKGWMQTWAVHMRHPLTLWRDLGAGSFLSLQLFVGGNVLAALIQPVFLMVVAGRLAAGDPLPVAGAGQFLPLWFFCGVLLAGYAVTVIQGLLGLARRGLLSSGWALSFVMVQWIMLSLAAWRALIQFWTDRYRWEKTEHGLARTSRHRGAARHVSTPESPFAPQYELPEQRSAA